MGLIIGITIGLLLTALIELDSKHNTRKNKKPCECIECKNKDFTFHNHYSGTVYSTYSWTCTNCGRVNCIEYQDGIDKSKPWKPPGMERHYLSNKRNKVK